jgi:hypothetical protein
MDLLMYSRFTMTCFGKWLHFHGVLGALEVNQAISVLWAYTDYDPSSVASCCGMLWMDHNPYTPTTQILLEQLLRHLRPPDFANPLPKHVGANMEYINKSN